MPFKPRTYRPPGYVPPEKRRPNYRQRGYGTQWSKLSAWYRQQPENVQCACGCKRVSEMVDHIIAVEGPGDPRFLLLENLQAMAWVCHRAKSARYDLVFGKPPDRSPQAQADLQAMLAAAKVRAEKIQARQGVYGPGV